MILNSLFNCVSASPLLTVLENSLAQSVCLFVSLNTYSIDHDLQIWIRYISVLNFALTNSLLVWLRVLKGLMIVMASSGSSSQLLMPQLLIIYWSSIGPVDLTSRTFYVSSVSE